MAMGKRRRRPTQASMWVATQDLPRSAAHPFYARLNQILEEHGFDALCRRPLPAILCGRRIADGRTGPGIDVRFRAWLLPDSNNPYDSNAVAILTDDGMRVGHLPREWAKEYHLPLAELRSQDFAPYCVATVIGGYGHKKSFGVLLDIRDPKDGLVAAF